MRVQVEGQRLRLRLDEAGFARLLAGETVVNVIRWPDGREERQALRMGAAAAWERGAEGWCVLAPEAPLRELAARLPAKEGIGFSLAGGTGAALEVLLDVDMHAVARRRRRERAGRGGSHTGT